MTRQQGTANEEALGTRRGKASILQRRADVELPMNMQKKRKGREKARARLPRNMIRASHQTKAIEEWSHLKMKNLPREHLHGIGEVIEKEMARDETQRRKGTSLKRNILRRQIHSVPNRAGEAD